MICPTLGGGTNFGGLSAILIIGIDCATNPRRIGLATGLHDGDRVKLSMALGGAKEASSMVASSIRQATTALLALDAPLGWPVALGDALATHSAGGQLHPPADTLFARETDHAIRKRLGKRPLEVGASFIARTAYAALSLLEEVRLATGYPIPLSWDTQVPNTVETIEVYPAATLLACGIDAKGYKGSRDQEGRARVMAQLEGLIDFGDCASQCIASADALDAALCVLAGADYLADRAVGPADHHRAQREGWVWVRDTGSTA